MECRDEQERYESGAIVRDLTLPAAVGELAIKLAQESPDES